MRDDFTMISSALRQYLPEKDTPYILDVDLDFFSTQNPFKNLHERANLYERLAPLYAFHRPDSTDPEYEKPVRAFLFKLTMETHDKCTADLFRFRRKELSW
ncbi:hypothetical protein KM043_016854 [Ampulex compressa]|nr:hypothetical protein KM043_016854 [Ampulex compressa]